MGCSGRELPQGLGPLASLCRTEATVEHRQSWEQFEVKGRKEALGKAAERKEEKHSGGKNSGGVEDKPKHWEKLLGTVQGAVTQR